MTAEDSIWDAVEMAIAEGLEAKRFRQIAADAWEATMKDQAKLAASDLLAGDRKKFS